MDQVVDVYQQAHGPPPIFCTLGDFGMGQSIHVRPSSQFHRADAIELIHTYALQWTTNCNLKKGSEL